MDQPREGGGIDLQQVDHHLTSGPGLVFPTKAPQICVSNFTGVEQFSASKKAKNEHTHFFKKIKLVSLPER